MFAQSSKSVFQRVLRALPTRLTTVVLALALAPACAATHDASDDDEAESELRRRSCEMGLSCPDSMLAIRGAARAPSDAFTGRLRRDLAFAFAPNTGSETHDATPRAIRSVTSAPMKLTRSNLSVHLAGNAAGDGPFSVDDNVLVEVLDTRDAVIASVVAGNGAHELRRGNATIAHVGAHEWSGDRYVVGAEQVELAPLLPKDCSFRLRISALDHGGAGHVSDVYLITASASPPPPPPPPPPVATLELVQSTIKASGAPIAMDFTAGLEKRTTKQRYDMAYSFPFYKMLVHGFNLEQATHVHFAGETTHFNITPITELTRDKLDGIHAWWQPKITSLRSTVSDEFQRGAITTVDRDRKLGVLNGLQTILDVSVTPLQATFERHPEVAKVRLDLR